jgi:hypothetical protein
MEERGSSTEDNDDEDGDYSSSEDEDARDFGRRRCVSFETGKGINKSTNMHGLINMTENGPAEFLEIIDVCFM